MSDCKCDGCKRGVKPNPETAGGGQLYYDRKEVARMIAGIPVGDYGRFQYWSRCKQIKLVRAKDVERIVDEDPQLVSQVDDHSDLGTGYIVVSNLGFEPELIFADGGVNIGESKYAYLTNEGEIAYYNTLAELSETSNDPEFRIYCLEHRVEELEAENARLRGELD